MKILLTIIYLFFTSTALTLFKIGGNTMSLIFKGGINFKINYFTLSGFLLYIVSFILWQKLIVTFDLSYIVPVTAGVLQVIILFIAYFVFKEKIDIYSLIGIAFIIFGIVILSIGKIK